MKKINLTKNFLIKEYINNKKSAYQIATIIDFCPRTIYNYLIKYNISIRTYSESRKDKRKGTNNSNYKHGKYCIPHYCKDCGKEIDKDGRSKRCCKCYWNTNIGKNHHRYGKIAKHGKGSYYKQSYMVSSYEIAYAQYCIINHIKYRYEPKAFEIIYKYNKIKKEGTYTPDFYLPEKDLYIEIKGWWRDDAKAKFNAFVKLYPKRKIKVLMQKDLKELGVLK